MIELKSAREIAPHAARPAGSWPTSWTGCARLVQARACPPWRSTRDVEAFIRHRGRQAGLQGISRAFPATVCISINEEVVHGIPSAQAAAPGGRHRRPGPRVYRGGVLRRLRDHAAGRARCRREVQRAARRHPGEPRARPSCSAGPAAGSATSRTRCSSTARATASGWCGPSWATASAGSCTRTRRCRTSGSRAAGPLLEPGMVLAIEPMVTMGALGGARAGGRLDGGDRGREPGRALRAHHRHHRRRAPRCSPRLGAATAPTARPVESARAWPRKTRSRWRERWSSRCRTRCSGWSWRTATGCWRTSRARCG